MKLLSLNIWGGNVAQPLLKFIKKQQDIDILCLQEVYKNAPHKFSCDDKEPHLDVFSDIQELLPNHKGFFRPVIEDWYGIGLFVKQDIPVIEEGFTYIHENPNYPGRGPTHSRILQWIQCQFDNTSYMIVNVHGLWNGKGKTDSSERIKQSQRIRAFMESVHIPKILCGDFNLRPDTESMHLLNRRMTNLIKTYNITSTRTKLYDKEEGFADYILVSSEIQVHEFKILPDVVSDHAPLLLDFSLPCS